MFSSRVALRILVSGLLSLMTSHAGGQAPYGAWHFLYPYDGNVLPLDRSRAAIGSTRVAACAQRTLSELSIGFSTQAQTATYVGLLPSNLHCGFQWLNGTVIVTTSIVAPAFASCAQFDTFPPEYADPPLCSMDCPPDQKDPATGLCRVSTPKNGGPPCPPCGNPVHPGTGNKYQAETDIPQSSSSQLGLVRHYNSGLPGLNKGTFGLFWRHNYASRVLIGAGATSGTVYRPDGKEFVFTLQPGGWLSDADINDTLTEVLDANQRRIGWTYRVDATDDTEHYNSSGDLTAIERRSGLTETIVYTDGTNGSTSGKGGFYLDAAGNPTTSVMAKGLLLRVEDHFGRTLSFGLDNRYRVVKVTDAAGGIHLYTYDGIANLSNLIAVSYPDGAQRTYHYNELAHTSGTNKPNALTGITDENGARFATYKYDSSGRAVETMHHASGSDVNRYQINYGTSGVQTTVTDPLGTARTYGFQTVLGVVRNTSVDQLLDGGLGAAIGYDANGNVSSRLDWNGNRADYTYDLARNLETSRTEGLTSVGGTTPQTRTISTAWDAVFRLPTQIAEPQRITTSVYDPDGTQCGARGALCSRTVQATSDVDGSQGLSPTPVGVPRAWIYTYNANGFMLTVDGPRTDASDVTTYTYYANGDPDFGKRGNVATVTNAAGHTTSVTAYDAHGQPLTVVDANGLTTTLTYDERKRLKTRSVGGETTSYDYDGVGQLTKVTLPDGSFLSYSYDSAHRVTGMEDNLGNRVVYTLDAIGNRTQEQVFDPADQLAETRSRVFNDLNRLFRELGAQNQITEYAYDDQGNVISVKDPLNRTTASQYDALNRLRQVTDPALGVTQYAYNGLDALTQVTDPRSLVTGYTVDGLGNLTQQQSPDTGTTVNSYDSAGNLLTQTDAKSQTATYAYDALNRVTLITFHDGSKQTYVYDQGANGIGRLSSITETDPSEQVTSQISYAYDQHGRVTSEIRDIAATQYVTGYRYDSAGRLDQLTYPSGRTVSYGFDALGRIASVVTAKDGDPQVVVQDVAYHPFGGAKSYTLGNGQVYSRSIDLDGRIASYTLGSQSFGIGYDAGSRIEFIAELGNPSNANTYGYDDLDRLTSAQIPGLNYVYGYDPVGNRTIRGAGSSTDTYAYSPTSNRIASITATSGPIRTFVFDPNGSTTADGNNTYAYDTRGRMVQAVSSLGTTDYQINALGQRIRKTNVETDRVFHYDTRGRLIAETDPGEGLKREFIHLGDIPVGVVQ